MGHRLSRIVTRTGDDGRTGLADGRRVAKDDLRIEALGTVDELNSQIGLLLAEPLPEPLRPVLLRIQHDLFDLGGELALPGHTALTETHVAAIEAAITELNSELPPLKEFILPGGSRTAALAHVCRTVARRAERRLVALDRREPVSDPARRYLNRLSDYFFVLARQLNRAAGVADVSWQGPKRK